MDREVVVTGIGIISPLESGRGVEAFWKEILAGKDAIKEIKSFDANKYDCKVAGEIKRFEEAGPNRWLHFLDFTIHQAIKDAGIYIDSVHPGLCIGTVLGGIIAGQEAWSCSEAQGGINDKHLVNENYHLFSGERNLTERYNINGPVLTLSTACASGTDAIGIAYRNILWGKADLMLAGGVDTLSEFAFSGFNSLKALTKTKVRPFDKNRDGLALGEGAAFLVLEEANLASKRDARIYGRIKGYASRADAHHLTGPDREGKGPARAMRAAMNEAKVSIVDYINAHGTGTVYNDAMETKAIKHVFGRSAYNIPVSSIKSMIGHSFGAGGAIEAAVCLLSLRDGVIPPTINYQDKDPECDLDYVPNIAREADLKTAISLSAGFGGQNSALLFERA